MDGGLKNEQGIHLAPSCEGDGSLKTLDRFSFGRQSKFVGCCDVGWYLSSVLLYQEMCICILHYRVPPSAAAASSAMHISRDQSSATSAAPPEQR